MSTIVFAKESQYDNNFDWNVICFLQPLGQYPVGFHHHQYQSKCWWFNDLQPIWFIANIEIQTLYQITNTNTFKTSPNIILTSTIILSTMTPNLSVLHCKSLSPFSEFHHNQSMICTWIRLISKVKVFKNIIVIHNSCSCAPTVKGLTYIHWMTINIPRSS